MLFAVLRCGRSVTPERHRIASPSQRDIMDYILYVKLDSRMLMQSAIRSKPIGSTAMIADALRGAICSGEIAPGAPLKQDEIAAEFGVSHTPVREALKALVSEGLATLHHNRGCFASDLSSTVARELMEFRAVLEPRLAGWAIDHLTDSDIDRKSTRLNSSHMSISYAVFCLKKKKK